LVSTVATHPGIGVIIPAYNPDPSLLQELIERLQKVSNLDLLQILILDDGSNPPVRTPTPLNSNVKLYRHDENQGKGAALRAGFQYYFEEQGFDLVLTIDADLQHPPEKIPDFIQAYREGQGGIIMGYRKRKPAVMPLARILSNTLTSLIISVMTAQLVRDSQCGFRLIDKNALANMRLKEVGFHLESEILILAGRKGIRFGFVEIPTIYQHEKSSIKNLRDTLTFILLIVRILKDWIFGYV
jgi:glycosyltransferase involved in cell wall biosynthesis